MARRKVYQKVKWFWWRSSRISILRTMAIKKIFQNPYVVITLIALLIQSVMLVLFFSLPDPLGLSLSDMFSGKILWQIFMAFGAVLVISSIFMFLKAPRAMALFYAFYFFLAAVDYDVFRFSHQRLSYSFLRTYFHFSNMTDPTTISTLGGDLAGTCCWLAVLFLAFAGSIIFVVLYTLKRRRNKNAVRPVGKKWALCFLGTGLTLSVIPLILFLAGTRGIVTIPVINMPVDMRFTLGKHTLTAPVLHIAAVETFEFMKDDYTITEELLQDLDSFLPADYAARRHESGKYPTFAEPSSQKFRANYPYNIVFIFGESFKGRILNQMLEGDTALAPNLWKLASGKYFERDSVVTGGGLWFKNAYSGGYPTVRGTTSTYLGFPSHPNRDVPSFYASNHFEGFPEMLDGYKKAYMTVSNPVFDHTLPFVEKFYGENWKTLENIEKENSDDSVGVDIALAQLSQMPTDSPWFLAFNTISTHIPFYGYPDDYAEKSDDAMERYRTALKYTDAQLGRFFEELSKRNDLERTVVVILGDHDTPVDSIDYKVPQPLGVSTARIFMGVFSADSNLFDGLKVREDVASQLDVGPTILDLAQVRRANHFWGYDLLAEERPAETPSVFFSQNAYYLGFRDYVLTGGLDNEDVFKGVNDIFEIVTDSVSAEWRKRAIGASKVLRSVLRNDNMMPYN